jgi:hypothetical protein
LVFVDLVAHLIRKNLGQLTPEEDLMLGDDFKFIFYVSFPKKSEGVGLEMCQQFNDLC